MDTELLPVPRRSLHSSCAINLGGGRRDGGRDGWRDGGVIRRLRDCSAAPDLVSSSFKGEVTSRASSRGVFSFLSSFFVTAGADFIFWPPPRKAPLDKKPTIPNSPLLGWWLGQSGLSELIMTQSLFASREREEARVDGGEGSGGICCISKNDLSA